MQETNPDRPSVWKTAAAPAAVVAIIIALAVASLVAYQSAYDDYVSKRREEARRLLDSFGESTERLFEYADTVLRSGRLGYEKSGQRYDWEQHFKTVTSPSSASFSGIYTVVDREGLVVYQSETPRSKLGEFGSMKDLDHFKYFKEHPGDSLFIGPTRLGRMTRQLQYRLARPLLTADGQFDGMVMLTLRPEYLISAYENLKLGPHASLTVLTLDAKLIARVPAPPDDSWGKDLSPAIAQLGVDLSGEPSGSAYGVGSPFEAGSKRDIFFRRVENYPVTIVVGLSHDDLWKEFAAYRLGLATLFIVFSVAALLVGGLVIVLRTRNQRLNAALLENERNAEDLRIAAATFDIRDGVLITDSHGKIIRVNEAFSMTTGYSSDDVIGKTPAVLKSGCHDEAFYKEMWSQIAISGQWSGEIWDRRKDGSLFPKWLTITAIRNGNGIVTHYVGTHIDISERKETEAQLEAYRRSLEDIVEQRTHQLTVAKEAAEVANAAKTSFLSNMSHELRTPLHHITALAGLLRRDPLSAKQSGQLDKIDSACKRLGGIVDSILHLADIETNRVVLNAEPVEVSLLTADIVDSFRAQAEAKGLALTCECAPLPCKLLGDASHLRTALGNYIANALRFTEAGGVSIDVSLLEDGPDKVLLRFSVTDTGIGIPVEDQARLFSIFEQVDNSSTRKYGGTGLGLAMTGKLAQLMGGKAGCESQVGAGSTFWFTAGLAKA